MTKKLLCSLLVRVAYHVDIWYCCAAFCYFSLTLCSVQQFNILLLSVLRICLSNCTVTANLQRIYPFIKNFLTYGIYFTSQFLLTRILFGTEVRGAVVHHIVFTAVHNNWHYWFVPGAMTKSRPITATMLLSLHRENWTHCVDCLRSVLFTVALLIISTPDRTAMPGCGPCRCLTAQRQAETRIDISVQAACTCGMKLD